MCSFKHVSSAESFRNLLAPSPSRKHAVKKFPGEKLFEEIDKHRALHERTGWYLKDRWTQRRGLLAHWTRISKIENLGSSISQESQA